MKAVGIVILLHLALVLGGIGLSFYGLLLAFKASLLLGVLVLVIEPAPFLLGVVAMFGHPEAAQRLATALGLG